MARGPHLVANGARSLRRSRRKGGPEEPFAGRGRVSKGYPIPAPRGSSRPFRRGPRVSSSRVGGTSVYFDVVQNDDRETTRPGGSPMSIDDDPDPRTRNPGPTTRRQDERARRRAIPRHRPDTRGHRGTHPLRPNRIRHPRSGSQDGRAGLHAASGSKKYAIGSNLLATGKVRRESVERILGGIGSGERRHDRGLQRAYNSTLPRTDPAGTGESRFSAAVY